MPARPVCVKGENIMKKGTWKKRIVSVGFAVLLSVSQLVSLMPSGTAHAEAAGDEAKLRILFTTDLHGQLSNVDYSTGAAYNTGGLSKAFTLLKAARQEAGEANTLTFDLGDVMYDYTTDYIYESDENEIQPMYQAMAAVGYDAITLGNHDFEYTLPYIQKQLNASGLTDKVVVSNITDAKTGAHVWNENKIIDKMLTTPNGGQVKVRVGVIGETIPTLSKKRCDYTGVLKGEDIVNNVMREAQTLKANGANIIVVLAHSGVGEENPVAMDENVCYALTKIPEVDVVLSGHKHAFFCADGTTKYDKYPGVDTKTRLVNGKNLVMVANNGKGIGMVDLGFTGDDQSCRLVSRKSVLRKVKKDTASDDTVSAYMGKWATTFLNDSNQILCEMGESSRMENYFGTIEDSGVMQLLNDIAISYGLQYKNVTNPQYKDLPIVAAAAYNRYGAGSGEDYFDISGNFTKADLYQMISYRIQLWSYIVTGSQLKEFLEWSASAYEMPGTPIASPPVATATAAPTTQAAVSTGTTVSTPAGEDEDDKKNIIPGTAVGENKQESQSIGLIDKLLAHKGAKPIQFLLQEEWRTNWSNFYIMDGIEYRLDTSVEPRYDQTGKMIHDTHRVTSLTRNGQPIADTDQVLLILNRLPGTILPSQFTTESLGKYSAANTREFFENYLDGQSMCGTMKHNVDDNWKVDTSDEYQYVVKTGAGAAGLAEKKPWFQKLLDDTEDFYYYLADFNNRDGRDTTGPSVNLKALNEVETNKDVPVAVQATDRSGIYAVRYLLGKYAVDSGAWDSAPIMDGSSFLCKENGVYSVMAMDMYGNRSIRYIRINNVNKSVLEAPKVATYTNRKTYIEGTAEPDATIYFEVQSGDIYKTVVKIDGTFKYNLPPQNADTKIFVYVVDDEGRASARTVVTVKRTGPNKPVLNKLVTSSRNLSGELNDANVYPIFFIDSKKIVYMQEDETKGLYEASEVYDPQYTVQYLNFNINEKGQYSFDLPELLPAESKVRMRTLDVAARNSMGTSRTVQQTVPAKPTMSEVTNLSKNVKVFTEEKCTSATLKVGKKIYTIRKATYVKSKKLYRYTQKIKRTDSGVALQAYLTNVKGNSAKLKATKKEVAPDTPKLNKVRPGVKKITGHVDIIGDGAEDEEVTVSSTNTKVFVFVGKKKYSAIINFEGDFRVKLKKPTASGDKIKVKARNENGVSLVRKQTVS